MGRGKKGGEMKKRKENPKSFDPPFPMNIHC